MQCSGTYELSLPPKNIMERMDTLQSVSGYYGFDWLSEEIRALVNSGEEEEEVTMVESEAVAAE